MSDYCPTCNSYGNVHDPDLHFPEAAEMPDEHGPSGLTESAVIAELAKFEYQGMTAEERAEVDRRWAATPEWKRQQLRDEIEMDLL